MAYSRIQGKKLIILHSRRSDGKIKQEKLFTFETFSDAAEIIDSESKWASFCDTLSQQFKIKIDKDKLKSGIKKKLASINIDDTDFFNTAVVQVLGFLQNCRLPLSPKQKQMLFKAKDNLEKIRDIMDSKLVMLDDSVNQMFEYNQDVEEIFHLGLGCYEVGKWDKARAYFLQGLKKDPEHVDLLVYAGLIELIHENHSLALNYFNDALRIGKKRADFLISNEPETYVKEIDLDKWAEGKSCDLIDECLSWNTDECFTCERHPKNEKSDLYMFRELRPFFRAFTNKANALMKLMRYEEAIDTLKLCQEYQSLLGTYNMVGVCYLSLDDVQKADEWYNEFLWDEAYYIKALIKFKRGQFEKAFRYLFQGVIKNPHIANIIIGKEKPEEVRYIGAGLPDNLEASEFYYEDGYLFSKTPDFKILVRCIMEDDDVIDLIDGIEKDYEKQKNIPEYQMDKSYWNLKFGEIEGSFINLFVPKFLERLNNKNLNYWKPKEGDILEIQILNKNSQNWLAKLPGFDNEFYFRPKSYFDCDEKIMIKVTKSWFYRKRLFISGEIVNSK